MNRSVYFSWPAAGAAGSTALGLLVAIDLDAAMQAVLLVLAAGGLVLFCRHPYILLASYIAASFLSPALGPGIVTVTVADYLGIGILGWVVMRAQAGRLTSLPGLIVCYGVPLAAGLSVIVLLVTEANLAVESCLRVMRLLIAAMAATLAAEIATNSDAVGRRIVRLIALCAAIGGIAATAQYIFGFALPFAHADQQLYFANGTAQLRGVGLVGESSSLANSLLFAVVVASLVNPTVIPPKWKVLVVACCVMGILVSFSRTAYIALAMVVLILIVAKRGSGRKTGTYIMVAAITAIIAIPAVQAGFTNRTTASLAADSANSLASGRIENWLEVVGNLGEPIFVMVGHGYKSIAYGQLSADSQLFGDNTLVTTLYEQGIVGLAIIVYAGMVMWRQLKPDPRVLKYRAGLWVESLRGILVLWLIVEIIESMTGDVLTYSRTLGPWFALYGIYLASRQVETKEPGGRPPSREALRPAGALRR